MTRTRSQRAAAAAVAALALAAGAAGAAGAEFPCQVRVKGRQRGDPECTTTVWRVPRAEARALGLKRRTVFRSCPSKRAQRRARRGKTQLAAGNLPGGDDKVLAGFEESSVTKSGFLWSAVTYDDAGAPTKSVMRDTEGTLIFAERAPAEAATSSGKGGRPRRRARGTSMTCRTGTDEVPMPGKDYELMLEDVPNHGLGSARANFEAGAPVAAVCAADGTPRAKVLYELDSDLVTRSYGGSVAAAVADVTDLTNLGSEQYLLQAGVELVTDIFVDTSQSPIGASYSGSGAFDVLRNFETRWRFSSSLRAKAAEYSLVHLISGKNLPADPGVLGIAFVSAACEGSAVAVSWVSLLDSEPDACKVALIMHENGHTFSLEHVNDRSAVMNPRNTCSLNFRTQSRAQIKNYVERNVGNSGCSCGASTAPSSPPPPPPSPPAPSPPAPEDPFPFSPPIPDTDDPLPGPEPGPEPPLTPVPEAPEPEATESCEVFGRRRKSECNRKPSGCIFQKKGKRCLRTPSNGGKCTDYRRKTCIRVGAPCSWTGGKKRGSCVSAATATTG